MADSVKVTIYIVRHGECSGNSQQKALDPATDFLTDVGKEQAQRLGESLQDIPFTRVYASDFPRTLQTAEIILKKLNEKSEKKLTLETKVGLRERDYTGVIGLGAAEALKITIEQMQKGVPYLQTEFPNSETCVEFEKRVANFFSGLVNDLRSSPFPEETLLFVSHALLIQRLIVLLNQRPSEMGVASWTKNVFAEKLMRNTNYHRLILEIPRDSTKSVAGHVDRAHFKDHVMQEYYEKQDEVEKNPKENLQDQKNYTFLEINEVQAHKDEISHYLSPV